MNRTEKIEFLKDLSNGKRSIKELEPVTCYELVDEQKDLYVDRKTGKIYTHDEVKEKIKKSVHYKVWINSERIPDTYDFKQTLFAYYYLDPNNLDEACLPSIIDKL